VKYHAKPVWVSLLMGSCASCHKFVIQSYLDLFDCLDRVAYAGHSLAIRELYSLVTLDFYEIRKIEFTDGSILRLKRADIITRNP
jgi:hypothetical protein